MTRMTTTAAYHPDAVVTLFEVAGLACGDYTGRNACESDAAAPCASRTRGTRASMRIIAEHRAMHSEVRVPREAGSREGCAVGDAGATDLTTAG
jgi:hypothetical protein